ncbi:hypothetical protein Skr01_35340 [Sphaerisporangium krabiense]|nr:hypothetical protein Skr01_35340 [Sphaerisporangium krabiense]
MGVTERIAQQFAHHEDGVLYGGGEHPALLEIGAETLACDGDAGRRIRQQHDALTSPFSCISP